MSVLELPPHQQAMSGLGLGLTELLQGKETAFGHARRFTETLARHAGPDEDAEQTSYGLSISANGRMVSPSAIAPPPILFQALIEVLNTWKIGTKFRQKLGRIGEQLRPVGHGLWLECDGEIAIVGWTMTGQWDLEIALANAYPGGGRTSKLRAAATEMGLDSCLRLSHALGPGGIWSSVSIPLPEGPTSQWLTAYGSLCDAIKVKAPTLGLEALLEANSLEGEPPHLTVDLTPTGISRVGLLIPTPSASLVAGLREAQGDTQDLTQVESKLGVSGPEAVEITRGGGSTLSLHYHVIG